MQQMNCSSPEMMDVFGWYDAESGLTEISTWNLTCSLARSSQVEVKIDPETLLRILNQECRSLFLLRGQLVMASRDVAPEMRAKAYLLVQILMLTVGGIQKLQQLSLLLVLCVRQLLLHIRHPAGVLSHVTNSFWSSPFTLLTLQMRSGLSLGMKGIHFRSISMTP